MNRLGRRLTAPAWALASGAGLALAAPPFDVYPALWLGMAALAGLLERAPSASAKRRLEGAARGLAFGVGANLVAFQFVPRVITRFTPLPWPVAALALLLLASAQAGRWVVAAMVRSQLARRGVPSWASFALGVYAGTFFPMVFPWNVAGGVTPWPAMVQLADVVGERGVTALMALSAGLAASAWSARSRRLALGAVAIPLAQAALGAWRVREITRARAEAPTAAVTLLQPSIGATERWDPNRARAILEELTQLTARAESRAAELTVWPEAAYPYVITHDSRRAPVGRFALLGPGVHGPVLTGAVTQDGPDAYNSAVVASPDGALSRPYDKLHLLWFGETVPLADQVPWLRRTFARGVGLAPGSEEVALVSGPIRAAVLNCFEDTLPGAGRDAMRVRPNLLVNITNDAWFAGSAESELHLRMARMRAVEERRDLVRAVNFGPTTWIDAAGVERGRYDAPLAGMLSAHPALLDWPTTIFGRIGDAPWALALAVSAWATVRRARRRSAQNAEGAAL